MVRKHVAFDHFFGEILSSHIIAHFLGHSNHFIVTQPSSRTQAYVDNFPTTPSVRDRSRFTGVTTTTTRNVVHTIKNAFIFRIATEGKGSFLRTLSNDFSKVNILHLSFHFSPAVSVFSPVHIVIVTR